MSDEQIKLNSMCITCKCLGKDCNGTSDLVWTGCVYRGEKLTNEIQQN